MQLQGHERRAIEAFIAAPAHCTAGFLPLNGHFRRFSSISTKRHKNYIKRSSESASHTDFTPEKVFLGICMRGHASVWRFPKNWKEAYLHRHRTRSCQRSHCRMPGRPGRPPPSSMRPQDRLFSRYRPCPKRHRNSRCVPPPQSSKSFSCSNTNEEPPGAT